MYTQDQNKTNDILKKKYLDLRDAGNSKALSLAKIEVAIAYLMIEQPREGEEYLERVDERYQYYNSWNEEALNMRLLREFGVQER